MTAFLEVKGLIAGYGGSQVVQDVSLTVARREVVGILGRNGVGKTTLIHSLMGLVEPASGEITFDGDRIDGRGPENIARKGISLVPQGRRVFGPLSVEDNLKICVARKSSGLAVDMVYSSLPELKARRGVRAGALSGGEQQMLAIGRALIREPSLILLDEPLEGLAPRVVEQIASILQEICRRGVTVVLVEQNLRVVLDVASRVLLMNHGSIVYENSVSEFRRDRAVAERILGVNIVSAF